ncbi:MAG: hypothetical protein IT262_22810 [Saprospiraceae bacterium]|nr:hypothetical protein [Saprospiraceae bacterium]
MKLLVFLLMMIVIPALFVVGIIYSIARMLGAINFNPESKAWKAALERLRTRMRSQAAGMLVPWDEEMLSLLSLNQSVTKKPGWFDRATEGVVSTIYQEPVVAYASHSSGNTGLLLARTSNKEFIFRIKAKETEVWVDGQPFAVLIDGTLLAAGRGSKILARLESGRDEMQVPVLLGDKTAAAISHPNRTDAGPNPRAVTLLRPVNADEELALLALALLQILKS